MSCNVKLALCHSATRCIAGCVIHNWTLNLLIFMFATVTCDSSDWALVKATCEGQKSGACRGRALDNLIGSNIACDID